MSARGGPATLNAQGWISRLSRSLIPQPLQTRPMLSRFLPRQDIAKAATGISGLDAVTGGGLPAGRPTLICGAAGCGKTLFGMTFLVKGGTDHGEMCLA